MRIPLLPRLCEGLIFVLFHSTIPLAAEIGPGTRCGHRGVGIVIHPDARIGSRCLIRVQVVIGTARRVEGPRIAPEIGDGVVIGVGAKILGAVRVGNGANIGANAVVLEDVPAGALAVGVPARIVTRRGTAAEPANGERRAAGQHDWAHPAPE
jgi:serine O-acetyltransferase